MFENKALVKIILGLFILDIVLTVFGINYLTGIVELNRFGRYVIENYSIWLLPIFLPISILFTVGFVPWVMKKFIQGEFQKDIGLRYYYIWCIFIGSAYQINNVWIIGKVMMR